MNIINYILDRCLVFKNYISSKVAIWILNHRIKKSDQKIINLRLYIHLLKNMKTDKIDIGLNSINESIYSPHGNIKLDLDDIIKFVNGINKSNYSLATSSAFLTENNKTVNINKYFLDGTGKWLDVPVLINKIADYSTNVIDIYEELLSRKDYETNYNYNLIKKFLNELEPMLKSLSSMK